MVLYHVGFSCKDYNANCEKSQYFPKKNVENFSIKTKNGYVFFEWLPTIFAKKM